MDEPTRRRYAELGLNGQQRVGTRPALVVVDLAYGFTDPGSPLGCDSDEAVAATAALLAAARAADVPRAFTRIAYGPGCGAIAGAWMEKLPALASLTDGSRATEIDARVAPEPGEPVITKLFASAFFGTPLASWLAASECDSVVLAGASTSGCVRATAVDALQHGYRVVVVRDAVADRARPPHDATLFDIDAKYGEVVDLAGALDLLRSAGRSPVR